MAVEAGIIITIIVAAITLFAGWTATVVGVMVWLSKQFQASRHTMHGALSTTRMELIDEIEKLERLLRGYEERLRKLEIEQAGWPTITSLQRENDDLRHRLEQFKS